MVPRRRVPHLDGISAAQFEKRYPNREPDHEFRYGGYGMARIPGLMLTTVHAGPYTVRGVSVAGLYTTLHIPEIHSVFDIGLAPRSFASARNLFLSHGHPDHAGALGAMLGIRTLIGVRRKLRIFAPAESLDDLRDLLVATSRLQGYPLEVELVGMLPGDEVGLRAGLRVRALRTHHAIPSLGYQFYRHVRKLRVDFRDLPEAEIARRRATGEDEGLFEDVERRELAYVTDTLPGVLDDEPGLAESRVLIYECTFLDERKSMEATVLGRHTHLDDLLDRASLLQNEHIVLIHFSQIYKPPEVIEILRRRCPPHLHERIVPFVPECPDWPG